MSPTQRARSRNCPRRLGDGSACTARRFGRKGSSEEELFPILRKLAGYQDDGTKSYQQVPEGLSEELLEQRLGILLKEAELGRREGGNKQFLKDAKKFERSRSKSQ